MTSFVGRRREAARIRAALEADRNVVLTGPFGIGRTALARHAARTMAERFRFVFLDGDRSPARLCRELVEGLFEPGGRPAEGLSYQDAAACGCHEKRRPSDPDPDHSVSWSQHVSLRLASV
jgi:MoxR-like ATPase